jgi:hypothetical protein
VSEPQISVGHFRHQPSCNVAGLLTGKSQTPAISADLESAEIDVAAVEIVRGE